MLRLAPIHTERTTIRVAVSTDAPAMAQAVRANAERLAAWMGPAWPAKRRTPASAQRMLDRWTRAARDGTGISCIVERHDRGAPEFAGQVELSHVRGRRSARTGWWLTADAEGCGLMQEALTAFLSICRFRDADSPLGLGIRQIVALVNTANVRSISLAERCGFISAGDIAFQIAGEAIPHRRFVIGG